MATKKKTTTRLTDAERKAVDTRIRSDAAVSRLERLGLGDGVMHEGAAGIICIPLAVTERLLAVLETDAGRTALRGES